MSNSVTCNKGMTQASEIHIQTITAE